MAGTGASPRRRTAAALLGAVAAAAAAAPPSPPLSFISASNTVGDPHFYDDAGRVRIFHGVNRVQKNSPWYFADMLTSDTEMDLMAQLGVNVIRMGFMWSGYNPAPGVFNQSYVDANKAIVAKLAARGIHTLLDMHQDGLSSKYCLYDGAPLWVVNKTVPRRPFPWPLKGECSSRGWEANILTEAAGQTYQDLYDNHEGMLDDLADFWRHAAAQFRDVPGVIGYEVINEPFAGDVYKNPLLFLPGVAGERNLQHLHDTVAAAIREGDDRHIIFYEPVTWGMIFNGEVAGSGYSHVPGGDAFRNRSAFSYHYYCNSFDLSKDPDSVVTRVECDAAIGPLVFKAVRKHLDAVGGAQMMTEGMSCTEHNRECYAVMADLDKSLYSWTDYSDSQGERWEPPAWQLRAWARPFARAVAGRPLNMTFDNATRAFEFCWDAAPGAGATEVFASVPYQYPDGAAVDVTGAAVASAARVGPAAVSNASSVVLTAANGGGDACVRIAPLSARPA